MGIIHQPLFINISNGHFMFMILAVVSLKHLKQDTVISFHHGIKKQTELEYVKPEFGEEPSKELFMFFCIRCSSKTISIVSENDDCPGTLCEKYWESSVSELREPC